MKFALHYSYQSRTGHWVDAYHNSLEQIALAEKYGFDMVTTSEHHMVEDNGYFPSNMVTAAGIATRTEKMRIGTCVLLLPFYHPLAVAEDAAVLDIMSRGRFVLGGGTRLQAGGIRGVQCSFRGPRRALRRGFRAPSQAADGAGA